jgi:hypothetical protein
MIPALPLPRSLSANDIGVEGALALMAVSAAMFNETQIRHLECAAAP